jgi:uncharacterized membrane protein
MQTWWNYVWDSLQEKLWFIPSLCSLLGVVTAVVLLSIDYHLDGQSEWLPAALRTTGSAARTVLGALIGGLVTVAGLVFSLTMLLVSQTASQYGPRLIRNVFERNLAQSTLGLFLGTIVYTMIVLRSIRDLDSGERLFTPNLSILLAELSGAACVFSLLAFANHVSRCMRAEMLIEGIFEDLTVAADRIYPRATAEATTASLRPQRAWSDVDGGLELRTQHVGYLQAIDLKSLLEAAVEHDLRLEIACRPGDFIYHNGLLMTVDARRSKWRQTDAVAGKHSKEWQTLENRMRGYFFIGLVRTPRQDIEAALLELVEAGVRALSPGVNDPTTAINAIDYLTSILCELSRRTWPCNVLVDEHEVPRVCVPIASFPDIVATAFDQLRQFAGDSVAVQCRILEGLEMIARESPHVDDRRAVHMQAEMIIRQAERHIEEPHDLSRLRDRFQRVQAQCFQRDDSTQSG